MQKRTLIGVVIIVIAFIALVLVLVSNPNNEPTHYVSNSISSLMTTTVLSSSNNPVSKTSPPIIYSFTEFQTSELFGPLGYNTTTGSITLFNTESLNSSAYQSFLQENITFNNSIIVNVIKIPKTRTPLPGSYTTLLELSAISNNAKSDYQNFIKITPRLAFTLPIAINFTKNNVTYSIFNTQRTSNYTMVFLKGNNLILFESREGSNFNYSIKININATVNAIIEDMQK